MPSYLSPEWVQAFNDALSGLDLSDAVAAAGAASLTVAQGTFSVAQVVTGGPEGLAAPGAAASPDSDGTTVRTVLTVDGGRLTLVEDPTGAMAANVTVVLTYDDAVAIAAGHCIRPTPWRPGGYACGGSCRSWWPGKQSSTRRRQRWVGP